MMSSTRRSTLQLSKVVDVHRSQSSCMKKVVRRERKFWQIANPRCRKRNPVSEIVIDNVILTADKERLPADSNSSFGNLCSPTSGIEARVSYVAYYYDAANRLTDSVDVGTDGGSSYSRPGSPASRSDTALVTHTDYDSAGNVYEVTDPRGIITQYSYDM